MATIGFIGIGHMGLPMAINLKKAGHIVTVFDLMSESLVKAQQASLLIENSSQDAACGKEYVITMLPEGKHVRAVYLGSSGILEALTGTEFLIDCSTIDVETAREVARIASSKGFKMVDSPVSGGVAAAEIGSLTFMVGGEEEDFQQAYFLFKAMGSHIFHTGGHGNGQLTKICNNLMLAAHMIITSEAFILAETLGLRKEELFEVASVSSGQSWSLSKYCPVPGLVDTAPSNKDYKAGFTAAMMLKDLGLADSAAQMGNVNLPMGHLAYEMYKKFCESGQSQLDFSGIINRYQ